jgi:hypothetical protein
MGERKISLFQLRMNFLFMFFIWQKYLCANSNYVQKKPTPEMFNAHQLTSSRALEMLESGEMSDFVIEVQEEQNGGQEKKVFQFI